MDGMRGLAILLVLMYHYWQLSWWSLSVPTPGGSQSLDYIQFSGALGVELFFFISAFCLCYPHAKAMFGLGPVPTLRHFYYRRFIKIVPSYVLALVVFGVGFASMYTSHYEHGRLADFGVHLLFLHNFSPQTLSSFDGVMWSLAVEVQFYYVFPLLAWLFRRWPKSTVAAMAAVAICWRFYARSQSVYSSEQWGNQLPGFFDLFAFGMFAAYLIVWLRQRPNAMRTLRWLMTAMAITAFVLLLAMFHWQTSERWQDYAADSWKSQNRQWLAAIFLFLAVCSAYSIGLWRRVLANPVLTFLSTISYNLYLWHQSVGLIIREHRWWKSTTDPPMNDPHWRWTYMIVAVGASILIATTITYLFERPLLRHGVFGVIAKLTRGRINLTPPLATIPAGAPTTAGGSSIAPVPSAVTPPSTASLLLSWARGYAAEVRHRPLMIGGAAFVLTVLLSSLWTVTDRTYLGVGAAFNRGHLGLISLDLPNSIDLLPFAGEHRSLAGPVPAVLAMPWAGIFGTSLGQAWIAALFIGVLAAATWVLMDRHGSKSVLRSGNITAVVVILAEVLWLGADGSFTALALLGAFTFAMLALAEWNGERRWGLIVAWSACACESYFSFYVLLPALFTMLVRRERRRGAISAQPSASAKVEPRPIEPRPIEPRPIEPSLVEPSLVEPGGSQ